MEPTYIVNLEAEPKASDINAITLGLMAYNNLHAQSTPKYVIITLRDGEQQLVGGLVGLAYLDWLHVQALWLQEELRGHGYGSSMLAKAEAEAIRLGCTGACLETLSFQALPFYQKRGYAIYGELADFPIGGKKYSLSKLLASTPEATGSSDKSPLPLGEG